MKSYNSEMVKFYIERIQENNSIFIDIVKLNKKDSGHRYQIIIHDKTIDNRIDVELDTINEIRCFLKGFWYGLPPF